MDDIDLLGVEDCDFNILLDEDLLDSILENLPADSLEPAFASLEQHLPSQEWSGASDCSSPQSVDSKSCDENQTQCQVCGDPASKHSHYGAKVCQSCRAFFRRSVQSGKEASFSCKGRNVPCPIDSKSWKSCKRCRFDHCIAAGMKPGWVLNDSERKIRNAKIQTTRRNRKMIKEDSSSQCAVTLAMPANRFTIVETMAMKKFHDQCYEFTIRQMAKFMSQYPDELCEVISVFIRSSTNKKPASLRTMRDYESFTNERLSYFFEQLSDFNQFCLDDRMKLILTNIPYFSETLRSLGLSNIKSIRYYMGKAFKVVSSKARVDSEMAFTEKKLREMNLDQEDKIETLDYGQLYRNLWRGDLDERHRTLTVIFCDLMHDENCYIDDIFISLICLYMLFSSEGLALRNQKLAEDLQSNYLGMIQRYLREKYSSSVANRKTMQIVYIKAMAKESYDIRHAKESSILQKEENEFVDSLSEQIAL